MNRKKARVLPMISAELLNDDALNALLITSLDADIGKMDTQMLQRLSDCRHNAQRKSQSRERWLLAHPALATILLAAIVVPLVTLLPFSREPALGPSPMRPVSPPVMASNDVTLIVAQASPVQDLAALPMLKGAEDIDFYGSVDLLLWLEQ